MYITAVRVRGMRDLPLMQLQGLERVVRLRGPSPASTALADALSLAFASLRSESLAALLDLWGLLAPGEQPELHGHPFPDQATWRDRVEAEALVQSDGDRSVHVDVDLALDPPLFAMLRSEAAREPRALMALSQEPRVGFGVSALFARSWDAVALTLKPLRIGDEEFTLRESERPAWAQRVLAELGHRFLRDGADRAIHERTVAAATSRTQHLEYRRWTESLQPAGPQLRAARGAGGQPMWLGDELPMRRWGPHWRAQAELSALVYLGGADILWTETQDPWIEGQVEGEHSPLEQVWRACPEGDEFGAFAEPKEVAIPMLPRATPA
jgi:hypothetical protein